MDKQLIPQLDQKAGWVGGMDTCVGRRAGGMCGLDGWDERE